MMSAAPRSQPTGGPQHGVPSVVNVAGIADPVHRNHAINQSYHQFDREMVKYTGNPVVCSWVTYGQHASREAGRQIRNLQAGLKVLEEALVLLPRLVLGNTPDRLIALKNAWPMFQRIFGLLQEDGLMKQSLQLAFAKAGIAQTEVDELLEAAQEAGELDWNPIKYFSDHADFAEKLWDFGVKLAVALPDIIAAILRVYSNMAQGNQEIYENIAHAYNVFLRAALTAPQGVPNVSRLPFTRDRSRFVEAAFMKYAQAHGVFSHSNGSISSGQIEQRNALMHEANILIGFQEQLIILQPIFDTMQAELTAMNGTMVINDPNGVHPLRENWGDFHSRMGLVPSSGPTNLASINANNLPAVHAAGSEGTRGTIAEYFTKYLTDGRIHQAPPPIAPM